VAIIESGLLKQIFNIRPAVTDSGMERPLKLDILLLLYPNKIKIFDLHCLCTIYIIDRFKWGQFDDIPALPSAAGEWGIAPGSGNRSVIQPLEVMRRSLQ